MTKPKSRPRKGKVESDKVRPIQRPNDYDLWVDELIDYILDVFHHPACSPKQHRILRNEINDFADLVFISGRIDERAPRNNKH
jgi:hypothetical protein